MQTVSYRYPRATVLRVTGRHAERYTNARLSNDIRLVTDSRAIEAACLTPQGRVLAYFTAFKSEHSYMLYCTGGERTEIIRAFKQFIVADQLEVEDISEKWQLWHVYGQTPLDNLPENFLDVLQQSGVIINRPRIAASGWDLLIANHINQDLNWLLKDQLNTEQFNYARVLAGHLSCPEELNEDFMFAESGLVHAVSNKKGCYAGQEAVEMLNARGQAANQVIRVRASEIVSAEQGVSVFIDAQQQQRAGSVLSCYADIRSNCSAAFVKIRSKFERIEKLFINSHQFALLDK